MDDGPDRERALPAAIDASQGAVVVALRADIALRRARRRMVGAVERTVRSGDIRIVRAWLNRLVSGSGAVPSRARSVPIIALGRGGRRARDERSRDQAEEFRFVLHWRCSLLVSGANDRSAGAFRVSSAEAINSDQLVMKSAFPGTPATSVGIPG